MRVLVLLALTLAVAVPAEAAAGLGVQVPLSLYGSLDLGRALRLEAGLPLDFQPAELGLELVLKWFLAAFELEAHPLRAYLGARVGLVVTAPHLRAGLLGGVTMSLPQDRELFAQLEASPGFERGLPLKLAVGLHLGF